MRILLIFVLLSALVVVVPIAGTGESEILFQGSNNRGVNLQQDFNFTIVPEGFADDFVEMFMDLIWDVDGDSDFDGILMVFYDFIPGLGTQGDVFVQVLFYFSIAGGAIFLVKVVHGRT
jgi:hypothetical protein